MCCVAVRHSILYQDIAKAMLGCMHCWTHVMDKCMKYECFVLGVFLS